MRNSECRCLSLFDDKLFNKCDRLNRHECVRWQLNRNVSFSAMIEWEMSRCQTTSCVIYVYENKRSSHTHTNVRGVIMNLTKGGRPHIHSCVCVCVTCDQWPWGWGLQQCILGCIPQQHSQVVINGSIGVRGVIRYMFVCVWMRACVFARMPSSPHRGMLTMDQIMVHTNT